MSDYLIVLTTVGAGALADAEALATTLVKERLAACVNLLPTMTSVYRWQGAVEVEREHQLVIKTTAARLEALRSRLLQLHPYDVPECLVLTAAGGSEPYLRWLRESTAD